MAMMEEFVLKDGSVARVFWVNGPPYLSVNIRKPKTKEPTSATSVKQTDAPDDDGLNPLSGPLQEVG